MDKFFRVTFETPNGDQGQLDAFSQDEAETIKSELEQENYLNIEIVPLRN